MDLPKNQATFDFDRTSESGKRYEGTFTVLCSLNIAQKYALELEKTRLLANYSVPSDGLAGFALVLSNLRTKIVDAPEWWKQSNGGFKIEDEDVLVALYDKLLETEIAWRESLTKKGQEALKQNQTEQADSQ
jgi:hypothetical protein